MIKVTITYDKEQVVKISLKGHADYAEHGNDVVCAGASCCFIGALNALHNPSGFNITYQEGDGEIEALSDVSEHDNIVLKVLVIQLKTIEDSYPQNLKVITERR